MKAVCVRGQRGAPEIICEEVPTPELGEGEILIRVRAAAVTPTELEWMPTWTTHSGAARPLPIIPGHEFSGEVCGVAAGVTEVAVGDAVCGLNDWFRAGTQAEYCVAKATQVAAKPSSLDHVDSAVVPISALTAWQALVDRAQLKRGQRVLIHGASGAVGVFAVQLARWGGAHVIATAAGRNLDFVGSLGADETIDYQTQRFEERVGEVDVVFDMVGGDTLTRSWAVLKPGGKMVTIATSEEANREPRVRDAFFIVEANRGQLTEIARLIDGGTLRAVVDGVFPLARAAAAYAFKPMRGKAVLKC